MAHAKAQRSTHSNQLEFPWGHNMMKNVPLVFGAMLLSFLAAPSWADGDQPRPVHGAYTAELNLNPLGLDRIEAFGFALHTGGTVVASSEHEVDDLESAGIGVWKALPGGQIGVGVFNFRIGTAGGCTLIFGTLPPDNCLLKLGATLERAEGGGLVGNALLSFEALDGTIVTIPVPLPFTMKRLSLGDFPGASPTP